MRATLRIVRFSFALLALGAGAVGTVHAQSGVGVEVKEVSDSRAKAGPFSGNLELKLELTGSGLDKINAARVVVKEARDEKGNDLWSGGEQADFMPRDWNLGQLQIRLKNPARAAKTMRIAGNVELFVPSKDPNSIVKIDKVLTKMDKPLSNKSLKTEKLSITVLSPKKQEEKRDQNKLDDKKIAEIRAEAKKEGVDEKEVEALIELAKALQELGAGSGAEGAVVLTGKQADMDRLLSVRLLKADGSEVSIPSRSSSTSGDDVIMTLEPSEPPPADVTLELTLLTKKATMSVPYELKSIQLP
ncbi:MAG: hypothetical protein ACSLFQ_21905 [Thermoanaerobaculia bacterium]